MTLNTDRKQQLLARKSALSDRLEGIEDALDQPVPQDWEDMALERDDDEVLEGVGLAGQHELRQIEAALVRIDAGTYGQCASCGATIDAARLDAVPATPVCRDCAKQREG